MENRTARHATAHLQTQVGQVVGEAHSALDSPRPRSTSTSPRSRTSAARAPISAVIPMVAYIPAFPHLRAHARFDERPPLVLRERRGDLRVQLGLRIPGYLRFRSPR